MSILFACLWLVGCDPGERAITPIAVDASVGEAGYYTLGGERTLLLGFTLSPSQVASGAVTQVVKRIAANGGNFLHLAAPELSDTTYGEWSRAAAAAGVVLDTATEQSLATVSASVNGFNLSVLAGSPAQVYDRLSQQALNSLRGIRTVERHIAFWDLRVDDRLLVGDRPPGTMSAADSLGNYVIHIGGTGAVTVRFRDSGQQPRRVTVVGHLGTQRSEVLHPPYGREFTLLSNEARGGWMLIEPLRP